MKSVFSSVRTLYVEALIRFTDKLENPSLREIFRRLSQKRKITITPTPVLISVRADTKLTL